MFGQSRQPRSVFWMNRVRRRCGGWLAIAVVALALSPGATSLRAIAGGASAGSGSAEEIVAVPTVAGTRLQTRLLRSARIAPTALAIVSHGSPADPSRRPGMGIPTFQPMTDWLLGRGYMVALPLRRGYGATGGPWAESYGRCNAPDYYQAGLATAEDIMAVVDFLRERDQTKKLPALLVGWSAGGWGSLAAASRNPKNVPAVLNFAGGRGGGNSTVGNCKPARLIADAGRYGTTARIPSLWLYGENDRFFDPSLSRSMFDAYVAGGAPAQYVPLPPFGHDGHRIFVTASARPLWQPAVERFLTGLR